MIPLKAPGRSQAVAEASAARVVDRPMAESQVRDPRAYQLAQVRKRFAPAEKMGKNGATVLVFKLWPSDPDFPFELAHLDCDLRVPVGYPDEKPELRVRNGKMARGSRINIERGWERLVRERPGATLLALVNALDRSLEKLLSERKAETVKLVTPKDMRHLNAGGAAAAGPVQTATAVPAAKPATKAQPPMVRDVFTKEQVAEAKARRAREVRQLKSRMGRLSGYRSSADGVVFTRPIEPERRSELSPDLRCINSLHLILPLLYPLQQLRIQLNEADAGDAEPVERLFARKAAE